MEFYDSADWPVIPHGTAAALYVDGEFRAPPTAPAQLQLTAARWITVAGDYRQASILDWEPGNPCYSPAGLRRHVRGRRALDMEAWVYCDRADAAEALAALVDWGTGDLAAYDGLFWWISTLDGENWTADTLAADLASRFHAPIHPDRIAANQYANLGNTDISRTFLTF